MVRPLRVALTVVATAAAAAGAAAVTTAAASAGTSCRLAWMSSSVQMPNSKQRRNLSETAGKMFVSQAVFSTHIFHCETLDCTVLFTSYKFFVWLSLSFKMHSAYIEITLNSEKTRKIGSKILDQNQKF